MGTRTTVAQGERHAYGESFRRRVSANSRTLVGGDFDGRKSNGIAIGGAPVEGPMRTLCPFCLSRTISTVPLNERLVEHACGTCRRTWSATPPGPTPVQAGT